MVVTWLIVVLYISHMLLAFVWDDVLLSSANLGLLSFSSAEYEGNHCIETEALFHLF